MSNATWSGDFVAGELGRGKAATGAAVDLGSFADRDGVGRWGVYSDGRMWGGLVAGAAGTGKSVAVERLGVAVARSGVAAVWVGQIPARSVLDAHAEDVAHDLATITGMLTRAVAMLHERKSEAAQNGWHGFGPDTGQRGVMILLDDCAWVFADPVAQRLAAEIAGDDGKHGIALVGAAQSIRRCHFGPDEWSAAVLAQSLRSGNLLLYYMPDPFLGQILGAGVDPSKLPKTPGNAYLIDRSGIGRSGPLM